MTRILLIGGTSDRDWYALVDEALASFGTVFCIQADQALDKINKEQYEIAIVDATELEDVEFLISRLRARQKDCRIVVFTASPTWQRARAAFEAGAMDYVPKSYDKIELHETVWKLLKMPLIHWPR